MALHAYSASVAVCRHTNTLPYDPAPMQPSCSKSRVDSGSGGASPPPAGGSAAGAASGKLARSPASTRASPAVAAKSAASGPCTSRATYAYKPSNRPSGSGCDAVGADVPCASTRERTAAHAALAAAAAVAVVMVVVPRAPAAEEAA